MNPSELEKHQLETHVELCAQRYKFLEDKMENIETNVSELKILIREIHDLVQQLDRKRNTQIITWGVGIIGAMTTVITYLVVSFLA